MPTCLPNNKPNAVHIISQIVTLTERPVADGGKIADDMHLIDAGISGATLIRPSLERLRNDAALSLEAGLQWIEVPTRKAKPSQTCHRCGVQRKKALGERWHVCDCAAIVVVTKTPRK